MGRERGGIRNDLSATAPFRFVEGEVGVAQQGIERRFIARCDGPADARAADAPRHLGGERIGEAGKNTPGYDLHFQRATAGKHDQEFIAADPGNFVAWTQRGTDAIGHLLEDGVAHRMAERVVDILEPIEIDRDQCNFVSSARGSRELRFQQIEEGCTVPQTGQRVALGQRLDPPEGFVARHDVFEHASAHKDRADVKDADEDRQYGMHDIGAQDQGDGEGYTGETDLPDRNQRPAGVAGRDPGDVADDAAVDEKFDVGPGGPSTNMRRSGRRDSQRPTLPGAPLAPSA